MLTRMFSNEEREYRPQIFKNQIKNEKGWGPFSKCLLEKWIFKHTYIYYFSYWLSKWCAIYNLNQPECLSLWFIVTIWLKKKRRVRNITREWNKNSRLIYQLSMLFICLKVSDTFYSRRQGDKFGLCDTSRQPDELEKGQEVKGKTTYSFDTRIQILVFI